MDSIFHNPEAFEAFHDETVAYRGVRRAGAPTRRVNGSVRCCVIDSGLDDAFASSDDGSDRLRVSIRIPRYGDDGWTENTPPQIGDAFTRPTDGRPIVYHATAVRLDVDSGEWIVEAREA